MAAGEALAPGLGAQPPVDPALPPLREDLRIFRGGASYTGAPVWMVLDPLRNRFFRLSFEMFQLLSLWNRGATLGGLARLVQQRFGREAAPQELDAALRMLDTNHLLAQPAAGGWRALHQRVRRHAWFMELVHNYLFLRIPLVRPQPFLRASWPWVAFLFSRGFVWFSALLGLLGLYLVSRQWESFAGSFQYVFSFEGLLVSVLSIIFVKSLHELGHAYTAHRHGCQVPTMGVAIVLLVPMLYTDTTDAWRLKSRRARLMIDLAGVATELCVGAIALFLWSFVPDGGLRSALFVLAATSWIMTLAINVNPLMRFDGYYVLSDAMGIENLQPRAFAHMRWRLRELLFGLRHPPPEPFPARLDGAITLYAVSAAIYRIVLYTGIALFVYHFTIKLLGIAMFAVEIGFFFVRPVWMEVRVWWQVRREILRRARTLLTLLVVAGLVVLAGLPLSTRVSVPAVLEPAQYQRLYAPEPGRIDSLQLRLGQQVRRGEVLVVVAAPALSEALNLTRIEIELARGRLARVGASSEELAERGVLENDLRRLLAKRDGLAARIERLVVRAPFDARVTDMNATLAVGQWVARTEQLAYLAAEKGVVVRGYVSGDDSARLRPGATGWFIPDDLTQARSPVELSAIGRVGEQSIEIAQLSSRQGGEVAVHDSTDPQRLLPVQAQFAVTGRVLTDDTSVRPVQRGVLLVEGEAQSLFARVWRQVLKVLVSEAGL